MELLNEQTIKRLQKLAGIQEIRVIDPLGSQALKEIIEPLRNTDHNDLLYIVVYSVLIGWVEDGYGANKNPTGEYTHNIQEDLDNIKEGGNNPQELIDWIEKVENLPPYHMYVYNNGPYESFKFTTDSKGELYISTPSGVNDNGELMSIYDIKGNLVPNN